MKRSSFNSDSDSFSHYVAEIALIPLLSPEEERLLAERSYLGDEVAREGLVRSHLRLAVVLAQRYAGFGVPVADLVAEANVGLLRAADLFNPKFEAKFGTYATFWIKQKIQRAIINQSQSVRLPVWKVHRLRRMQRVNHLLAQQLGHEPTIEELATALDLERTQVESVQNEKLDVLSLDSQVREGDDDSPTLAQTLADESSHDPSAALAQKDILEALLVSLNELEDRELRILSLRFGLTGEKEQSLNEIGSQFKVSREWIRRLQSEALLKLRRALSEYRAPRRLHEKKRLLKRVAARIHKLTGQPIALSSGLTAVINFMAFLPEWVGLTDSLPIV